MTETRDVPALISNLPPDIAALLELGGDHLVNTPIELPDGRSAVFVGKDVKLEILPALNPKLPDFVSQTESFVEPDSFVEYITKFKTKNAIVRAAMSQKQFTTILDYHGDARMNADTAVPGRGAHIAILKCPYDQDYDKWRGAFDKPIAQTDLMEFLEDVIHTIGAPLAGDLLDAIGNVELDRASKFKSVRNLRNGTVQFTYAEDERTSEVVVPMPETISIVTPIFQGGMALQLDVKLRYHLEKGVLLFKLVLPGREKLERDGFRTIGERVRQETSTPVFYAG